MEVKFKFNKIHFFDRKTNINMHKLSVHWTSFFVVFMVFMVAASCMSVGQARSLRIRRSATSDDNMEHSDSAYDRIHINYDEYPVCNLFKKPVFSNATFFIFLINCFHF